MTTTTSSTDDVATNTTITTTTCCTDASGYSRVPARHVVWATSRASLFDHCSALD
jgi:hypothetical protein